MPLARGFVPMFLMLAPICLSAGCKAPPNPTVEDPRSYVIEALLGDGAHCVGRRRAYCLEDPVLLGAVIDECADGEALPTKQRDLDRFARRCGSLYLEAQLGTPERRRQVEAKMRAVYEQPEVVVEGGTVWADAGEVPRELGGRGRRSWQLTHRSEVLHQGALKAPEVADRLAGLRESHPEATRLVFRILTPRRGRSARRQYYFWLPAEDKVGVVRGRDNHVVEGAVGPDLAPLRGEGAELLSLLHGCNGDDRDIDPLCPRWWPTDALFEQGFGRDVER